MRVMFWNIKFFTEKRIYDTSGADVFEQLGSAVQAASNRNHILNNIRTGNPDVFIMIEVRCGNGAVGSLADGSGSNGLLHLLPYLRQINNDWCLVPPLKSVGFSTYTEAYAVFYRSSTLNFTGPYIWPANAPNRGPKIALPANSGQAAGAYPGPWSTWVPNGTTAAGQFQFFDAQRQEIFFTDAEKRRPFLTTFQEINAPGRAIKIVTVHPKPNSDAKVALARLDDIREIAQANNQVVVLGGDFNVDYLTTQALTGSYFRSFTQLFGWTQNFRANRHGPTVTKDVNRATLNNYLGDRAWDNIFTRYGSNTQQAANPNPIVIDRVTGVPNTIYQSDMWNSIAHIREWYQGDDMQEETFRLPVNYGHIGSNPGTSDHLPLVLDV